MLTGRARALDEREARVDRAGGELTCAGEHPGEL
jgi:hypothetical protein